ncbi:MAG: aminoacetone oxidase family FAD-binding enzyme [Deltaproteobacteria bacterium]|nr:aminoacetone oxidase family FAD-binding enzyme [Deltaproteobacteria bacterium]
MDQSATLFDVIIIGAGAAGLVCAVTAGNRGHKALILEKNTSAGKKILASGGGRCNFTNLKVSSADYVSEDPDFCTHALNRFKNTDFINWVQSAHIEFFTKDKGQLFCKKTSRDILNMLVTKLDKQRVTLLTSTNVLSVQHDPGRKQVTNLTLTRLNSSVMREMHPRSVDFEIPIFTVKTDNNTFSSKNLVIATGGLSCPHLGSSDLGYRLARQFGHKVTKRHPALAGVIFPAALKNHFSKLAGVSLDAVVTTAGKSFAGGILFTHTGLSGPAVFNASLFWNPHESLSVDFAPSCEDFKNWLNGRKKTDNKKQACTVLSKIMPANLAKTLCAIAGVGKLTTGAVSHHTAAQLSTLVKEFSFVPVATAGFAQAEVTRGGVATTHIDPQTMESTIVRGLFFAGEVLDVTGTLGGYNLQWAWSSGYVAGLGTLKNP